MISYPRAMPEVGAMAISFEKQEVDYMSPETGGRIGGVGAGFPLWRMRMSLQNMSVRDADEWSAFIATLRGSRRAFIAHDLTRQRPRFPEGGPFSEVAATWSQSINADGDALLTLTGLLAGMPLVLRDYIGFRWDAAGAPAGSHGRLALVRVVERGAANVAGTVTVTVEPPVPNIVPAGAQAYFRKPSCLMKIVTGSTQLGEHVLGGYTAQGGVIEAVQELLR